MGVEGEVETGRLLLIRDESSASTRPAYRTLRRLGACGWDGSVHSDISWCCEMEDGGRCGQVEEGRWRVISKGEAIRLSAGVLDVSCIFAKRPQPKTIKARQRDRDRDHKWIRTRGPHAPDQLFLDRQPTPGRNYSPLDRRWSLARKSKHDFVQR